jgi:hypothetical protein
MMSFLWFRLLWFATIAAGVVIGYGLGVTTERIRQENRETLPGGVDR